MSCTTILVGKKASYYISPKRALEFMGYKRDEKNINSDVTACVGVGE